MDPIQQARINLKASLGSTDGESSDRISRRGILAALIAIATELRNLNAILHNATDLDGAVKVALPHPVEQALIAIAEQMRPQFVQVGPVVFSPDDISALTDIDGELAVWFKARHTRYFKGKERAAFLAWWNEYADVVRLPQVPDAPTE